MQHHNAKTERNAEIYQLRLAGKTLKSIGDKYGIGPARVGSIVNLCEIREREKERVGPIIASLPTRAKNLILRERITSDDDAVIFLTNLGYDGLIKLPNLGKKSIDLMLLAFDIYGAGNENGGH